MPYRRPHYYDPYDTSLTHHRQVSFPHASPSFHTSGVDGRKHLMPVPCRLNVAQAVDGAHGLGRDHVPKEDLTRHATGGQNVIGSGVKGDAKNLGRCGISTSSKKGKRPGVKTRSSNSTILRLIHPRRISDEFCYNHVGPKRHDMINSHTLSHP